MKTKDKIINLLRLTELQYESAVFEFAYACLNYYCADCTGAVDYLAQTPAFWKWWLRHFDIRDELFLNDYGTYTGKEVLDDVRSYWNEQHHYTAIEGRIPGPAWKQMREKLLSERAAQSLVTPNQTTI